jgi:hypothetical protein
MDEMMKMMMLRRVMKMMMKKEMMVMKKVNEAQERVNHGADGDFFFFKTSNKFIRDSDRSHDGLKGTNLQ